MTEDKFSSSAIGDPDEAADSTDGEGLSEDVTPFEKVGEAVRRRGSAVLSGSPNLGLVAGTGDGPVTLGDAVQLPPAARTVSEEALRGSTAASSGGELAIDDGVAPLVSNGLEDADAPSPGQGAPAVAVAVPVPDPDRGDGAPDGSALALVAAWESSAAVGDGTVARMELLADYAAAHVQAGQAAESLQRYRREIERYEEMVEVYDTILRHDLGNELQVITGFSDALQPRIDDEDVLDYVQRIHRTARNAADLVAAASDTVATLREGSDPVPTDLEPVLSRAVRKSEATYDSLETSYTASEFELTVLADDLLQDVFLDILANAAVHTSEDVSVDVYREEAPEGDVVVGFADDGEGVDPAVRDRVFEMGKHGPATDRPGFGLGLARAIVQSYGGSITLEDAAAGGADFRVRLPRVTD